MELVHKQFGVVRAEMDDKGEVWFVAKDVCNALGYNNVAMALQKLDNDEKLISKIFISGQKRDVWMINESGLYALILRSNKPGAKKFRKWVTSEVLPALRKYGTYSLPKKVNLREMLEKDDSQKPLVWHNNVLCVKSYWLVAMGIMTETKYHGMVRSGQIWRVRRGGNGRRALVALESLPYEYKKKVIELVEGNRELLPANVE